MRTRASPRGIGVTCTIICLFGVTLVTGQLPSNPCIPRCVTWQEKFTLWPAASQKDYWQCVSENESDWIIQLNTCPEGYVFEFSWQICLDQNYLKDTGSQCGQLIPVLPPQDGFLGECPVPSCVSFDDINTLWAITDPEYFLQCRPEPDGSWVLQQMPCAPATFFHFGEQVCVHFDEWLGCDGQESPIDPPATSVGPPVTPPGTTPGGPPVTTVGPPVTPPITPIEPPVTTIGPPATTPGGPPVTTVGPPVTPPITPIEPPVTTIGPPATTPGGPPVTTVGPPVTPPITPIEPPVTTADPPNTTNGPVTPPVTTGIPPVTTAEPPAGTDDPIHPDFCIQPQCDTRENIERLWPHPDPRFFYQCRPAFGGGWIPQQMPCAPSTVFSFRFQVCVWEWQWEDPCGGLTTGDGDFTTSPDPTTPYTTDIDETTTPHTTDIDETTTPHTTDIDGTTTPQPGYVDCLTPNCVRLNNTEVLWPTRNPQNFYRCIFLLETIWFPFLDSCPHGTYFSFAYQSCVDPIHWDDVCADVPTDITTTQMTTIETTDEEELDPPLPVICGSPRCSTPSERSIYWPSTVANQFYECVWVERLFQFIPFPRRCPNFLFFDFQKQNCVDPLEWVDICPIYPTLPPNCPDCCPTCSPEGTTTPIPDVPIEIPEPVICGVARCNTAAEIAFLWPSVDSRGYFECQHTPTEKEWWQAVFVACGPEKYFQAREQRCVAKEDFDPTFCPIYPPLNPAPTVSPEPSTCRDNFDAASLYPISCDSPRCSQEHLDVLWPSSDESSYFACTYADWLLIPRRMYCDPGMQFDFFRQCCTEQKLTIDVCSLHPWVPTPPSMLNCVDNFNATSILPAQCDVVRCESPAEIATFWPSYQPTNYYRCELQSFGIHRPVLEICPQGTEFDFFHQCCAGAPFLSAAEVCLLFTDVPTAPSTSLPSEAVCDEPRCGTPEERAYLWPSVDPWLFYSCQPQWDGTWQAEQFACPPDTLFLVDHQFCGEVWQHRDVCHREPLTSPGAPQPQEPILTPPNLL